MGNGYTKQLTHCFFSCSCGRPPRRRIGSAAVTSEPLADGLGHSFCYLSSSKPNDSVDICTTSFSLSGASVSANASTQLSTSLDLSSSLSSSAAAFDSSSSFSSFPLQPYSLSGPLSSSSPSLSGPIDGSYFLSGPLRPAPSPASLRRSLSHGARLIRSLSKSITRTIPLSPPPPPLLHANHNNSSQAFQWAQGKAGEDRIHVVVSEDNGYLFVGIYDGFNGPDATDYLLSNLYPTVRKELTSVDYANHSEVLKVLSTALRRTEEDYLDLADEMVSENPELALMGSCVLAMLMKGEDVYLMGVGDSRAVMGSVGKGGKDLERISEDYDCSGDRRMDSLLNLVAVQLTVDHSTCVEEEVRRIQKDHPDDACAVLNNRVKGSLKVTRAFGAGFLKQPKWNNVLLEIFRIDYVGTSPYITCDPFLYHHRLGPKDRFLILSSDGLYQYFTNDEAIAHVESFIATTPEGDPAQHLVEEVLLRAAHKAGLDFHELLEIPQGDRRRYHDDVSIIIISFEGRIWRSCM